METSFDGMASGYQSYVSPNNQTEYETTAEVYSNGSYYNPNGLENKKRINRASSNPLYDNATPSEDIISAMKTTDEVVYPREIHVDLESDTSPEHGQFQ